LTSAVTISIIWYPDEDFCMISVQPIRDHFHCIGNRFITPTHFAQEILFPAAVH